MHLIYIYQDQYWLDSGVGHCNSIIILDVFYTVGVYYSI